MLSSACHFKCLAAAILCTLFHDPQVKVARENRQVPCNLSSCHQRRISVQQQM